MLAKTLPPTSYAPLPARAIQGRLQAAVEPPSWASYLPRGLDLTAKVQRSEVTSDCLAPPVLREVQVAEQVFGQVWSMSRDPSGCRVVQHALEEARNDEVRESLVAELRGHVWDALRCPHANFVVQKAVVSTRPEASQFIIEELMMKGAAQAARHKYGCRIIQRILEHCKQDQTEDLVDALLAEGVSLSRHVYANFVMQLVLDRGTAGHRRCLAQLLERHACEVGADTYASAVMAKALACAPPEDQLSLARALVREPGLVVAMARNRYGYSAVKTILQLPPCHEREMARLQLLAQKESLRTSRYGRLVVGSLGPRSAAAPPPCSAFGTTVSSRPRSAALGGA